MARAPLRVLVTRPEPGASRTARRLAEAGYFPVVLPLTETQALGGQEIPSGGFDAVVLTSANAARFADAALIRVAASLPCFTVGAETAAIAREAGIADVRPTGGTAGTLADAVVASTPERARILYLCGRVRRPDMESILIASGRHVAAVETYDMVETFPTEAQLRATFGTGPIDAALVYSGKGAEALVALFGRDGLGEDRPGETVFICISERAAMPLTASGARMRISATPDEEGLFAALATES